MRNPLTNRPKLPTGLSAATALAPLFEELDDLQRKAIGLRHAIEENVREQKAAAAQDRIAGARALRQGAADPGDELSKAVAEKAEALRRKAGHVSTAAQAVAHDVEQALAANGAGWALEAQAQASKARRDAQAVLDTYQAGRELVADLEASARWLRSGGQSKAGAIASFVPGLVRRSGEPYSLSDVIAALAALDAEPVAPVDDAETEAEAVA